MRKLSELVRGIAVVLVAGLLAPVALAAIATHRHYGTAVVDGVEGVDEWIGAEAGSVDVILPWGVVEANFWVMNDELALYLGMRLAYPVSPPSPSSTGFDARAFPEGADPCAGLIDEFLVVSQDDIALVFDEYFLSCDFLDLDENDLGTSDTIGAWSIADGETFFEMRQPLDSGDALHDIQAYAHDRIVLYLFAYGCDGGTGNCGVPGGRAVNLFLSTADTIFFDDFESEDTSFWEPIDP